MNGRRPRMVLGGAGINQPNILSHEEDTKEIKLST